MAKLTCTLECEHQIEWNDVPGMPGADLPFVGRVAWCPECESDQEIISIDPEKVDVEHILLSETEPRQVSYSGGTAFQSGDKAAIFYDCHTGTWGYCFYGVGNTGLYSESDDVTGFESPETAREEALAAYKERNNE